MTAPQAGMGTISASRPPAVHPGSLGLDAAVKGIKALALPRVFWSGINAPSLAPGTIDHARQQGWMK